MRSASVLAVLGLAALATAACHSMSAYSPGNGRKVTRDEHQGMVIECRDFAQQQIPIWAGPLLIPWRRAEYGQCMAQHGWVPIEPTFVSDPVHARTPLSHTPPASGECGSRVADGIAKGLTQDELNRVLDGCMAEHGL